MEKHATMDKVGGPFSRLSLTGLKNLLTRRAARKLPAAARSGRNMTTAEAARQHMLGRPTPFHRGGVRGPGGTFTNPVSRGATGATASGDYSALGRAAERHQAATARGAIGPYRRAVDAGETTAGMRAAYGRAARNRGAAVGRKSFIRRHPALTAGGVTATGVGANLAFGGGQDERETSPHPKVEEWFGPGSVWEERIAPAFGRVREFFDENPHAATAAKGVGVGVGLTAMVAMVHAARRQREEEKERERERKRNVLDIRLPPKKGSRDKETALDTYLRWVLGLTAASAGALGTHALYRRSVTNELKREEDRARQDLVDVMTAKKGEDKEAGGPFSKMLASIFLLSTLTAGATAYATKKTLDDRAGLHDKSYDVPPTYKIRISPSGDLNKKDKGDEETSEVAKAALAISMDAIDDSPVITGSPAVKMAAYAADVDLADLIKWAHEDVEQLNRTMALNVPLRRTVIAQARVLHPVYDFFNR